MTQILSRGTSTLYGRARRRMRPAFLGVAAISAILNVLMLTGSVYMLQVYDRVLGSGSLATLAGLFAIVVVLYGFFGVYDALRTRLLNRAALRFDQELATPAFAAHLRASGRGGSEQPLRDLDSLRGFLGSPSMAGLFDLPFVPLFLVVLTLVHPWLGGLTLAGAGLVGLFALMTRIVTARTEGLQLSRDQAGRALAQAGQGGACAVLAMGMEDRVTDRWAGLRAAAQAAAQRGGDPAGVLAAASRSTRMLLQSAILTLGAMLTLKGEISAGMIIAASILSGRALAPIDQAIGQWRQIGQAMAAHRRLKDFFAKRPDEARRTDLPAPTGAIRLHGVSRLAAGAERKPILSRLEFALEPGDGLGVIGHSASGKSTLARLLAGADRPDLGEIRFDGATPDQWDPAELGRHVGYLSQQPSLLPGTLRENIARFDADASDADVIAAAKLTGTHAMILALPQGYETPVGGAPGSHPLSGGQLQRIGLARAVYGQPKIVVLDEPNAHLDSAGEQALTRAIETLRAAGSTVIVMAHRPAALAAVNKILVLEQGRVHSFGPREEFMAARETPAENASTAAKRAMAKAAARAKITALHPGGLPARSTATPPAPIARGASTPARGGRASVPPPRPAATARDRMPGSDKVMALMAAARSGTPDMSETPNLRSLFEDHPAEPRFSTGRPSGVLSPAAVEPTPLKEARA